MPINPLISLRAQPLDIGQTFNNVLTNVANYDQIQRNREMDALRREQLDKQKQIQETLNQIGQQEQLPAGMEGPPNILSQDELISKAKQIDPKIANEALANMGLDDPARRAEASMFAAEVLSLPPGIQNQRIMRRVRKLESEGRDPFDTLELLKMTPDQRIEALQGIQMLDLSTKERFAVQESAQRQRQATQKAFQPVTIVNPKTGEKRLVSPVVDNLTGKAVLEPFSMPEGFEVSTETPAEKRAADIIATGEKESAKLKAQSLGSTDKRFAEKLGEEGAGIYANLQKAAQSASAFIPRLQSLRDLAYKVKTGTGAEIKLAAKKALGLDSADMEELNAKLGELAQDILNQQTGTKTDFDFQNAVRQSAALGKTPEANVRLINALINRQQEAIYFGDQAKKAYEKGGVKSVLDMRYKPPSNAIQNSETERVNNTDEDLINKYLR